MAMAAVEADENRAPPGQENRKAYTADQKVQLLEDFIMARAAKEGDDQTICARLGVSRASIYGWKAQLERGEELTDTQRGPRREEEKEEPVAVKKKVARQGGRRTGVKNTKNDVKLEAVLAINAGQFDTAGAAEKYGVARTTVHLWQKAYKEGKLGKPPRKPNAHGKPNQIVMFEPEVEMATKKTKQPVSLGRVSHVVDADEVTALRTALALAQQENARLQRKIKTLVGLVSDD